VGNAPVQFSFGALRLPASPPSLLLASAGNPVDWLAPQSPDHLIFVGQNPREADRSMGSDVSRTTFVRYWALKATRQLPPSQMHDSPRSTGYDLAPYIHRRNECSCTDIWLRAYKISTLVLGVDPRLTRIHQPVTSQAVSKGALVLCGSVPTDGSQWLRVFLAECLILSETSFPSIPPTLFTPLPIVVSTFLCQNPYNSGQTRHKNGGNDK